MVDHKKIHVLSNGSSIERKYSKKELLVKCKGVSYKKPGLAITKQNNKARFMIILYFN